MKIDRNIIPHIDPVMPCSEMDNPATIPYTEHLIIGLPEFRREKKYRLPVMKPDSEELPAIVIYKNDMKP